MYVPYESKKPRLALDETTTDEFLKLVAEAKPNTVLEFGAGGSSYFFLMDCDVATLVSIETDSSWLDKIAVSLVGQKLSSRWIPIHADIGKTGDWGMPVDDTQKHLFTDYWHAAYSYCVASGIAPDLVFIDGRFRAVTALASSVYFDHEHGLKVDFRCY